jgi:uncharacterized protein
MATTTEKLFNLDTSIREIADTCRAPQQGVRGAVELFEDGQSIPFIARYRKERTGGLDESVLRAIEDSLIGLKELADRKATILKTIEEQGLLTPALRAAIFGTKERRELEELYLPYKPKRRTRAGIARERGLEPLAKILRRQANPGGSNDEILAPFVAASADLPDAESALRGACDILAEEWADDREIRELTRETTRRGTIVSKVKTAWKGKPSKFETYYDFREPVARVPSHRFLAIRRGQTEGVLQARIEVDEKSLVGKLTPRLVRRTDFLFRVALEETVGDCVSRLLLPSIESAELTELKEAADDEAIAVFGQNLRELLLASPAGPRAVLGIDPGFRTGCKVAVVDATGKFLEHTTIYPTPPRSDTEKAKRTLLELAQRHSVELIAIGNGTASRETDAFVADVLKETGDAVAKVTVSESGASIYSASDVARAEFPDLDLTVRGAISIARRLQDPLAELVKVDPKTIGVGQYQHDVNQTKLRRALDREVESCVNRVGVDLNTASAQLLSHVAGIGPKLGESIVKHRETNGRFESRRDVLAVPRLGAKAMTQAAGFLRIRDGLEPLDNSAVHPESYYVVKAMARTAKVSPQELIGNSPLLVQLEPSAYVDEKVGLPTVEDILAELEKPGRDPRKAFAVAQFAEGVHEISDLKEGMILEAVITNVTRFGAFADLGVHQDGLIHVSELDRKFVHDPADVVTVGDIVKVKILKVESERKRIALSRKQAM